MDQLSSATNKHFKSLIELVEAGYPEETDLRPPIEDDAAPIVRVVTRLGPCVGDDLSDSSDVRVKENVRRVGTTVFGLPLYHFRYIGQPETYEGVMAQEVLKVMPRAVSVGADGFYRVNYRALGTAMRRVS
jgi:hypothetical protein